MKKEYEEIENMSVNETDPRLRFDAFTGGIQNGGLRSVSSINMLVCYMVANIDGKVTAENIIETMDEGMIANHFEISEAIARLKSSGVIAENEDGALYLKKDGKSTIDLIEKDLPLSVREKSINICQKIIAREAYKRENKAEITKTDKGYDVSLTVSDIDTDYMALRLFASTIEQAEIIRQKFITNPIAVYEKLIDSIFENQE
ncbi:MAG: DUF4364 family protein [Eubacterium sp.]